MARGKLNKTLLRFEVNTHKLSRIGHDSPVGAAIDGSSVPILVTIRSIQYTAAVKDNHCQCPFDRTTRIVESGSSQPWERQAVECCRD